MLKVHILSLSVFLRLKNHSNLKLFFNILCIYIMYHNYFFTFVQLLYFVYYGYFIVFFIKIIIKFLHLINSCITDTYLMYSHRGLRYRGILNRINSIPRICSTILLSVCQSSDYTFFYYSKHLFLLTVISR